MVETTLYNHNNFEELESVWKSLQNGKDMTVFQQYIWAKSLNDQYCKGCFGVGEKAVYIVAAKNGIVKMIAPLHIKRFGVEYKGIGSEPGIYIIGKWGFTDYLNFIYDDFDKDCFDKIFETIHNNFPGKKIHMNFLVRGSSLEQYLNENFSEQMIYETVCVQTLPHNSFDEFHKTMTKYSRQNIRKAFNRENKTETFIHIKEMGKITKEEADEFFSIYVNRSVSKNELDLKKDGIKKTLLKYFNKRYNDKLKAGLEKSNYIIYNMVNNPDSYMIGIYHNNKKIGFIYGIMENKEIWRNIIVCFDEEYKYYTPGRTAYFRFFRDILYADGKSANIITDMSRGTERHKYELGGTEHYLRNYVI